MKRFFLAALLACALLAMPRGVCAHEYDRDDSDYPLRIVAYVANAAGIAVEYAVLRPIHWVVSRPNAAIWFGHEPRESDDYNYFAWEPAATPDRWPVEKEPVRERELPIAAPVPVAPEQAIPAGPAPQRQMESQDFPEMQTIYFAYDKAEVTGEQLARLEANLAWLKANPDALVQIIGNTDERGSTEYNYNLGLRRAKAVGDYLAGNGIATGRIQVQSRGEEAPADPAKTDEAYAKNRRAEFKRIVVIETSGAQ